MTSRSIVLSTAALLLFSAAPVSLGFSPTAVFAQGVTAEVVAAMSGDAAQLDPIQLRERISVLRDAVESGSLSESDSEAVEQRIEAYRELLDQQRGERRSARQDSESEPAEGRQPRGEREPGQRRSERGSEQQAQEPEPAQQAREPEPAQQAQEPEPAQQVQAPEPAQQVQAPEPAQQAQAPEPAQQAQPQEPAQQAQPQEPAQFAQRSERRRERESDRSERRRERSEPAQQATQAQISREMAAALNDNRPASALDGDELRNRIEVLREVIELGVLSRDQRRQVQVRIMADREALETRRAARQDQAPATETRERRPERERAAEIPQAEVTQQAREILADPKPADNLADDALRQRLERSREVLATGRLSREQERQLRRQLSRDREVLRDRVATQQRERPRRRSSRTQETQSPQIRLDVNPTVIIEQRASADRLSDRDLERRVRALDRAVREERIARRDAEIARQMVEQDRRELRKRLHAGREHRRQERRQARSRNQVFIDFNVGYRPPPVIFAAEAMPRDIEVQLVAPPLRQVSRAYSFQEISRNHDVREMMPGIEIDTLNFAFGSAEVRPEEIDKLDDIADVIERIIAERPDEVFVIEGHTDAVGSDAANDALSLRRAEAVKEALLDYYDIYPENLRTVGLGKRFLKIMTPDPEEENRRVTVRRITPLLIGARG
jgi:outer membrane protein OmpA-like peptidoglycan-associated protein